MESLLAESFFVPRNEGVAPTAAYNRAKDADGVPVLKTWVYPAYKAFRTYQFKMVRAALFQNTLVTLPTGLGKTFIAATVMLNFYRWFSDGQIFFLAPTKPLVAQQIHAFANTITEVDADDIVELTGEDSQRSRRKYYKSKRVFFMTPQTLENDIEAGMVDCERIVLLVLDEAHHAMETTGFKKKKATTKGYAYCEIIKALSALDIGFRVLALSATPVSKPSNLQPIINNLRVSNLEVLDDSDAEVKKYTHHKEITQLLVPMEDHIRIIDEALLEFADEHHLPVFKQEISSMEADKEARDYEDLAIWGIGRDPQSGEDHLSLDGKAHRYIFWTIWYCRHMLIRHNVGACEENFEKRVNKKTAFRPKPDDDED